MVGHQIVANWFHVLRWQAMSADVEKAANGALLTLSGKVAALLLVPMVLGSFGALYATSSKTAESTARLEEQFKSLVERQIPAMQSGFNGRFDAQADRITAHDYRINRLEDWRNMRGTP